MNIICEMFISDFFKLSTGHIALVGKMLPNIEEPISKSKADLYIADSKVKTIDIIGEDRFIRADKEKLQDKRAIRTNENIIDILKVSANKKMRLVIYS